MTETKKIESFLKNKSFNLTKLKGKYYTKRFIDQKCTPSMVRDICFLILDYVSNSGNKIFTIKDIWYHPLSTEIFVNHYGKGDPQNKKFKNEYDKVRKEMSNMEDEIKELRKKGVHEYEGQSMVVSEQYATAIAEGRPGKTIEELKAVLDTLAKYGGRYVSLRDELRLMKEEEVKIRTKLNQSRVDANQVMPATFRVNKAIPADKKKYPIRWLICVISSISTFVSTLLFILLFNTWKDLKKSLPS